MPRTDDTTQADAALEAWQAFLDDAAFALRCKACAAGALDRHRPLIEAAIRAESEARVAGLREAMRTAAARIERAARLTKTVYGGSEFAPVDYKVLTGSPRTLLDIATALLAATEGNER